MKYLLIASLLFISTVAKSQSLTGTLTNALPDSIKTWNGFRLTGPMAVYAYNKSSGNSGMTGLGIAYTLQHITTGGTWWVDEAFGIAAYAGGSQAPNSVAMIAGVGPYVSFFNGYLSIGGIININTGKPMVTVGVSLPLIAN